MSWVRATKVASAPSATEIGLNGVVERAERRGLGDLADLAGGRVLALGEPVDLVVEHDDLEAHVATQRVDQVVAADREHVAVAADDPHVEVGARQRDAGGHGRRTTVDRVHAVRVHVVREARRAPDAGHEHHVLRLHAELGELELHRREDRVVAATRAPADLLVGLEVLAAQLHRGAAAAVRRRRSCRCQASIISRILFSISVALNGMPCTLVSDVRVDEVLGPHQARQLAHVQLGHQHLRVARAAPRRGSPGTG